jgi:neutral amino acid transport system substrate-binding protein
MNTRILMIAAAIAMVAPALAGCATNTTTPTPTPATGTVTPATTTATATTTPVGTTSLDLKLGTMMPLTGELNSIGKQMQNSAHMAVDDVNALSATTGLKITIVGDEDDKTGDSAAAGDAYTRLTSKGATVIVGPCCSGVTRALIPKAVQDQVILASPSATAPDLTLDNKPQGFFWRVSPTDAGQGQVLADVVRADNHTKVAMIVVNNDYGNGLAAVFKARFEAKNGTVTVVSKYPETGATTFDSQVDEAAATNPTAIVLVAYADGGAGIMKAAYTKGNLAKFNWYASEGLHAPGFVTKSGNTTNGTSIVSGVHGTYPHVADITAFNTAYKAKFPTSPAPDQYAPESYDGVMYVALGALKAKSVAGKAISDNQLAIANPPGTKCTSYAQCAPLIIAGQDVDYAGVAHDLEYTALHEPKSGAYDLWRITDNGTIETYRSTVVPQ